jgi:SAM-dependent methyltransferase
MVSIMTYGSVVNTSFLEFIGRCDGRVLDLGCGQGAWVPQLRARGATALFGVDACREIEPVAGPRYDRLCIEPIESFEIDQIGGPCDVVIAADVLEHLQDPWAVLRRARAWVTDNGQLFISVPNLRYWRVARDLVVSDRFEYSDEGGIMDRSHLRWFTNSSLDRALRGTGWTPRRWDGHCGRRAAKIGALLPGSLSRLLQSQLHVAASPCIATTGGSR